MLQVSFMREFKDQVLNGLKKRGWDAEKLQFIDQAIELDNRRKAIQTENDQILSQIKKLSAEVGGFFKSGEHEKGNALKSEVTGLKSKTEELENEMRQVKLNLDQILYKIPNIPNDLVPVGLTDEDNEVFKDLTGEIPSLHDGAKAHWDLIEDYNLIDFKLGAKITGSGFPLYRGKGAKLQRALISYFLDKAIDAGYEEFIPPHIVNPDSGFGTGSLPDKDGQMYYIERDNLYLIPTAEVPVTNIYRDVILKEDDFPIKMCAYTPCFRREAGSHGSEVKGLNRVHQFDKIEIVQIAHPDKSYEVLDQMLKHVEGLLQELELPYRILRLCGGDLTFASALTYDFEVYSAAQKRWLEVSSVSNFETFQSNRMKLRFKNADGKTQLAHTLNGSALALARIVASLLENNQTEEGIVIPKVLHPYTGFDIIKK